MISLLSFSGKISRWPYLLWSSAAFFSQHLFILLVLQSRPSWMDWTFYVLPLRSAITATPSSIVVLAYGLLAGWVLAGLAFRRAADANISEWFAAAAIVPFFQIPVVFALSIMPARTPAQPVPTDTPAKQKTPWIQAAQGALSGTAVTLFSVAVSTLVFHVYGYGLFVVSPFIVGAIAGYVANRDGDIGKGSTVRVALGAAMLGGLALVATALEGIVCIVMAAPIGFGFALAGGLLGRAIARLGRRSARDTAPGLALLPLVFALEYAFPPMMAFDTLQTVRINASPSAVWNAIIDMNTMDEPPGIPFRLGVAYPIRGEIVGAGVGAMRRGEFSTGTAIERVIEWIPERKLSFVVEKDVPAMHEISPYEHVHAPHAIGYFRTSLTSFELTPRADGGTELIERTAHQLKLDPATYWLPMARWIVHENNMRVLAHIRRQAEQTMP
jgi:uncharacterized membrane protein YhaH (DUF805 family)